MYMNEKGEKLPQNTLAKSSYCSWKQNFISLEGSRNREKHEGCPTFLFQWKEVYH